MEWKHESVLRLIDENIEFGNDPIKIIREKSKKLTLEAFSKGWNGPPFNVIELAGLLNIDVFPNEATNDARIIPKDDDSFLIEYNPYNKIPRINFSLAHEVGHTLFSDCNHIIRNRENNFYDFENDSWELEFLCNIAAAEILLPFSVFYSDANNIDININDLLQLSNKYAVSIESLFIRFTQVINKPCTTLIAKFSDFNRSRLIVQYSNSSIRSNLEINSGFEIPPNSCAYECKRPGWTSSERETWPIFDTSNLFINSIGLPPVKGENNQRVGILINQQEDNYSNKNNIVSVYGDATEPQGKGIKIIVQVVNSYGAVGSGFGKSMAKKYPITRDVIRDWKRGSSLNLGKSKLLDLSEDKYVFLMVAQKGLYSNDGSTTLDYNSLKNCLEELSRISLHLEASIHMPLIGSGQARGNWEIIKNIIFEELVKKGLKVSIYVLPGTPIPRVTNQKYPQLI